MTIATGNTRLFASNLLGLVVLFGLLSCTGGPAPREDVQPEIPDLANNAEQLLNQGDAKGAAATYWSLAASSEAPQKQALQLRAIEILLDSGEPTQAESYLAAVDPVQLSGDAVTRYNLARATLAMANNNAEAALQALPTTDTEDSALLVRVLSLRADALTATERPLESARTRIRLHELLENSEALQRNRLAIWESLAGASPEQLEEWEQATGDTAFKGWLALARIGKVLPPQAAELEEQIATWQLLYPGHPANPEIVDQIRSEWAALQLNPRQIAVMLPMAGRYQAVSNAILAGVMAAYFNMPEGQARPRLLLYDTGDKAANVSGIYNRAVEEGAELVMGPLRKDAVDVLIGMQELPVPVLSLNYGTLISQAPENLFQFGLLPEDEARQAADRGNRDGHSQAIVLSPEGVWGERLLTAFRERFEELGGTVLAEERYVARSADYSEPIKRALYLDQSEKRHIDLQNTLQQEVEYQPRRRRDVDMFFVAAAPRNARLIKPQLAFFYATEIPVYATSHIYSGFEDQLADSDMDGMLYVDMPWSFPDANPKPELRRRLDNLFPESSTRLPRLTALGVDALQVAPVLKQLAYRSYDRHAGLTGKLYMDDSRRIHRELRWATFVDGLPRVEKEPEQPSAQ